ncbi:RluA family pseudouridine synthase [Dissulfuribacter thermophilus]|nr:RluA family pseudouridine synthase [Dissulfuribacter thermophilus]
MQQVNTGEHNSVLCDLLRIIYEDNHLIVIIKPPCMPSVPDISEDLSAYEWVKTYIKDIKKKPGNVYLGIFQRLDRPASGILAFSKTSKSSKRMTDAMKKGLIKKQYLALTEGTPKKTEGEETLWLKKDRRKNVVTIGRNGNGQRAVTKWKVLNIKNKKTLFLVEPKTGRPHQIRVTLSHLGCPILGDVKYGASAPLRDRSIALHATRLSFPHPTRKELMTFTALPYRSPFPKIKEDEVSF